MTKPFTHQILSLSLAAVLTAGLLSGLGGLADQQHRHAVMAQASASQTLAQRQPQAEPGNDGVQAGQPG